MFLAAGNAAKALLWSFSTLLQTTGCPHVISILVSLRCYISLTYFFYLLSSLQRVWGRRSCQCICREEGRQWWQACRLHKDSIENSRDCTKFGWPYHQCSTGIATEQKALAQLGIILGVFELQCWEWKKINSFDFAWLQTLQLAINFVIISVRRVWCTVCEFKFFPIIIPPAVRHRNNSNNEMAYSLTSNSEG